MFFLTLETFLIDKEAYYVMSTVLAWTKYRLMTVSNEYVRFAWFLKSKKMVRNSLKLLERLDQPILDVIDNPEKTQQTTAIGTLFWQTL